MLINLAVVGTIAMDDYMEAGSIVFLFSIAEWLESRASHKVSQNNQNHHQFKIIIYFIFIYLFINILTIKNSFFLKKFNLNNS